MGRIQRSADFERVLGQPSRARSAHFAVHHLAAEPSEPRKPKSTAKPELSTGDAHNHAQAVDESPAPAPEPRPPAMPQQAWLGMVVPKRHARRAVTRNLLKRQIRGLFQAEGRALPPGLWVVRLRAPFDRKQFVSARSEALSAVVRAELRQLLERLQRGASGRT
ncbi:ribonuclease P protein component [Pelomonas sp. CA6]|nr:ribonuclease P protein component [Pelomonas sp. CA6]